MCREPSEECGQCGLPNFRKRPIESGRGSLNSVVWFNTGGIPSTGMTWNYFGEDCGLWCVPLHVLTFVQLRELLSRCVP